MTPDITSAARDDILRQVVYFRDLGRADLARSFPDAVERSISKLVQFPNSGAPRHSLDERLNGLRSFPTEGFEDIRIYYLVKPAEISVLRILHGRRDIARLFGSDGA